MSDRLLVALARLATAVSLAFVAVGLLLFAGSWSVPAPSEAFGIRSFLAVQALVFSAVGLTITSRRPRHPVGWLLLGAAVATGIGEAASEYAHVALVASPGSLPGGEVAAWLVGWIWIPSAGVVGFVALLFPDGRFPSTRWRPVGGLGLLAVTVSSLAIALAPGSINNTRDVINPFGIPALAPVAEELQSVGLLPLLAFMAMAPVALGVRFRRAAGIERQQLKFLFLAGAFLGGALAMAGLPPALAPSQASLLDEAAEVVILVAFLGLPVSIGVAILRYRLYEIDVVIRRTLVYAVVVAILGIVYVGLILALQALLSQVTGGQTLPVAVSTLAIAALFGPVRVRVREAVDRRFYRSRYDAQQTLDVFAVRLRDEVELDAALEALRLTAWQSVQPAIVGVWLRGRAP